MADIDRLEVGVEASAAKADAELDKLIRRLEKVSDNLTKINGSGLAGFADGIERLGKSMQTVNSTKTADFTRLAKNIQKIADVDSAALNRTASSLYTISKSLNTAGAATKSSEGIATLAGNLGKLGGKSIEKAITNLPKLASELKNLMTTLSQSPNVSKNVIQMTNALANLSNSMKGIRTSSAGSTSSSTNTSSVRKLSDAFSGLSGNVTKSRKAFSSFSQLAGKFYSNFFMLIRGLKNLGNAIVTSMDYVETYNYFAVTMDKIGSEFADMYERYGYESADAYAESFSGRLNELTKKMTGYNVGRFGELTSTGSIGLALDPQAIMNYQASISAITNSVGLLGENSVNASKALTMLAADMSSLKNVDLSTAMTNFQSGLIGQSRALYKYGIDITNNTLQTYAYGLGLQKAVSEMTQAEKMQLRLVAILDQSKVAWGDQARTINSVANQYRIMKQQVSNLARVIGNLFLPIVQKVLPVVNGLVIAMQRLFTALGFKLWGGNWLKDTMEGIAGIGGGDALGDLADNADDATSELKDAGKAAEKLRTTILGIDELNINAPDDSGSGSGTAGTSGEIDLSGAIGDALADYESIWDAALADSQNKAQEYADAITATFTRIWKAIEPFRESVKRLWDEGLNLLMGYSFQNLKDFYNEFLVPIGTWAFGTEGAGLTRLVDIINKQLMRIDWPWISKNLKEFWRAIEPYAEQFGEGLIDFFDDISGVAVDVINKIFGRNGAIVSITDWLNNNDPENARRWGRALGELATAIGGLVIVNSVLSGIYRFIALITGSALVKTVTGLASGIKNLAIAIMGLNFTRIASDIQGFLLLVKGFGLHDAMSGLFGSLATTLAGIGTTISGITLAITNFFSMWENGFSWLNEALMALGTSLAAVGAVILGAPALVAAAVAGVVAAVATVGVVIHDNWDKIVQFFTDSIPEFFDANVKPWFTKEKWSGLLKNIKQSLKEKWNETVVQWSADLSLWWNENVSPWFTREKWVELYGKIKTSLKNTWDDTVLWWKSAVSKWWNENVAPWFTVEKWNGVANSIKISISTKFKEMVYDWKSNIKSWWDNHVAPWFTASKWLNAMDGIREGFKNAFKNAANAAIDVVNRLIRYLNEKLKISWDGFKLPNGDKVGSFSKQLFKIDEIPHFASGGYPNSGELFLARENGINEMVGQIGSRNAVANNDQITDAIRMAVVQGMNTEEQNALLREQNDLLRSILEKDTDVQLDGRSLVDGIDKARRRMGWNFQPV